MFPLDWLAAGPDRALRWRRFLSISVLRLALVPLFGITSLYVGFYILRRVLSGNGQLHGMLVLVEKVLDHGGLARHGAVRAGRAVRRDGVDGGACAARSAASRRSAWPAP